MDGHETDRLFCQIVGRLHVGRGDESEVTLRMLVKPFRQPGNVQLLTMRAPLGKPAMLVHLHRLVHQLDLLKPLGRLVGVFQLAAATRTGLVPSLAEAVHLVFGEQRTLVPRMALLTALFPLRGASALPSLGRRMSHVARRGLGGVGRVLERLRQLAFQLLDSLLLRFQPLAQPGAVGTSVIASCLRHDGDNLTQPPNFLEDQFPDP